MEGSAVLELQKRLEISVLHSNPEKIIDEMEDTEFVQLASRVVGEGAVEKREVFL